MYDLNFQNYSQAQVVVWPMDGPRTLACVRGQIPKRSCGGQPRLKVWSLVAGFGHN